MICKLIAEQKRLLFYLWQSLCIKPSWSLGKEPKLLKSLDGVEVGVCVITCSNAPLQAKTRATSTTRGAANFYCAVIRRNPSLWKTAPHPVLSLTRALIDEPFKVSSTCNLCLVWTRPQSVAFRMVLNDLFANKYTHAINILCRAVYFPQQAPPKKAAQ